MSRAGDPTFREVFRGRLLELCLDALLDLRRQLQPCDRQFEGKTLQLRVFHLEGKAIAFLRVLAKFFGSYISHSPPKMPSGSKFRVN